MRFFYENRENEFFITKKDALAFAAHFHSSIEIVYILKGSAHAFSAGCECTLQTGDFFITFPNCIHYYDNCSDDISVFIAIVPYAAFPEYRREFSEMMPKSPKIEKVSSNAVELFEKIISAEGEYKEKIIKAYLSAMIGIILEKTELVKASETDNTAVQSIIKYCRENYMNNITLNDVSKALHISKSRISHIFSEKLHMSFRTFINVFRLNDAERLLKNRELSVTEIVLQSGFESVRTFNRAFLKHFGQNPSKYRVEICNFINKS